RSWTLTRGQRARIALLVITVLLTIVALPFLVTVSYDQLVTPLLWWLPERNSVLIPAMLTYVSGYVLLTLAITFFGIAVNALLSACLDRKSTRLNSSHVAISYAVFCLTNKNVGLIELH